MDRPTLGSLGMILALSACARSTPLAAPVAPAANTPAPSAPALTTAALGPPPSGWPSAGGTIAVGREGRPAPAITSPLGRGCVRPEASRTGEAQPDLELRVSGPARMAATEAPAISASLRNVSRTRNHHIVLSGDGSDAGWRDPVISFTAFIDHGDGCWRPLERQVVGRCGMFDPHWSDDVVALRAGQQRSMDPLWGFPAFVWKKGTVRLFVHYAWTGGAASKGGGTQSLDLGKMAREKPYELVSNALEFEVTG